MRLYTFRADGVAHIGAERDGKLVDLSAVAPDMLAFIRGGQVTLDAAHASLARADARTFRFTDVILGAPLPRPGKILCSGLNYRSHIQENPAAIFPDEPDVFSKVPSVVIGPGAPIVLPPMSSQVDYEVEFAAVIGNRMFHTPANHVMEHLFGYTILHDVSARDIQMKAGGRTRGKNFDTFAPMGPCIVTTDELTDPNHCQIRTYLNGSLMQDGNTADWIFPLPILLHYLSSIMALEPGDVISTGTCSGTGFFRNPKVFLKPGDVCMLEIQHIGKLTNPVVAFQDQPQNFQPLAIG